MKFIARLFGSGIIYFCVATVLALVVGVGMLWFKGYLTEDRFYDALAALNGIDEHQIREKQKQESSATTQEQKTNDIVKETVK